MGLSDNLKQRKGRLGNKLKFRRVTGRSSRLLLRAMRMRSLNTIQRERRLLLIQVRTSAMEGIQKQKRFQKLWSLGRLGQTFFTTSSSVCYKSSTQVLHQRKGTVASAHS